MTGDAYDSGYQGTDFTSAAGAPGQDAYAPGYAPHQCAQQSVQQEQELAYPAVPMAYPPIAAHRAAAPVGCEGPCYQPQHYPEVPPPLQQQPEPAYYQPAYLPPAAHFGAAPGHAIVMHGAAAAVPHGLSTPCACTAGWVLFGIGFLFPICWIIGIGLACCTRSAHDSRAAVGSGVALSAYALILLLFLVILPMSLGWYTYNG